MATATPGTPGLHTGPGLHQVSSQIKQGGRKPGGLENMPETFLLELCSSFQRWFGVWDESPISGSYM